MPADTERVLTALNSLNHGLGAVEAGVAAVGQDVRELKSDLKESQRRTDEDLRALEATIDRRMEAAEGRLTALELWRNGLGALYVVLTGVLTWLGVSGVSGMISWLTAAKPPAK